MNRELITNNLQLLLDIPVQQMYEVFRRVPAVIKIMLKTTRKYLQTLLLRSKDPVQGCVLAENTQPKNINVTNTNPTDISLSLATKSLISLATGDSEHQKPTTSSDKKQNDRTIAPNHINFIQQVVI